MKYLIKYFNFIVLASEKIDNHMVLKEDWLHECVKF